MVAKQSFFYLCSLLVSLWFGLSRCHQHTPTYVYIADLRSPKEVRRAEGFRATGIIEAEVFGVSPDISLFRHARGQPEVAVWDRDGFIATSTDRGLALDWVNSHWDGNGYVYRIHVSPNFIDVVGTLGQYTPFPDESEYAALGRIRFGQIVGWSRIANHVEQREELNRSYQDNIYDRAVAGGVQPQLAGFPHGHPAWNLDPWLRFSTCTSRQSKREVRQDQVCSPKGSIRSAALDIMAKMMYIEALHVQVNLTGHSAAGTTDTILLGFQGSHHLTKIFEGPSSGDSVTIRVDLYNVFGYDEVSLFEISQPVIMQLPAPHPIMTDDFQLHGIVFEAALADTTGRVRNSQYASVDAWLGTEKSELTPVWMKPLDPQGWEKPE